MSDCCPVPPLLFLSLRRDRTTSTRAALNLTSLGLFLVFSRPICDVSKPNEKESGKELGLEAAYNRTALIIKFGPLVNLTAAQDTKKQEGGCQVNGPKVAKFLDR